LEVVEDLIVSKVGVGRQDKEVVFLAHSFQRDNHNASVDERELWESFSRLDDIAPWDVDAAVQVGKEVTDELLARFELFVLEHVVEVGLEVPKELIDQFILQLWLELLIELVGLDQVEVQDERGGHVLSDAIVETLGQLLVRSVLVQLPQPDVQVLNPLINDVLQFRLLH